MRRGGGPPHNTPIEIRDHQIPESFPWRDHIPVTYPGNYNTLFELACKSEDAYIDATCPKCFAENSLLLKPWLVNRGVVWFDSDGNSVYIVICIPLALCQECSSRVRVLPFEILPYKTFSLSVIETICYRYLNSFDGLRNTVETIQTIAPHFSTLHGWLGGIGTYASDNIQLENNTVKISTSSFPPVSTIVTEAIEEKDIDHINCRNRPVPDIAPFKYTCDFRKRLLESCFKLLLIAQSLFQKSVYPLTTWGVFNSCCSFPARSFLTHFQLTDITTTMVISNEITPPQRAPP